MEGGPLALPPEAAGSRTGSAGRAHLRPGSLSAAPRGGQRERPHLTQGRGKSRGSGALSHRRHPGASTVPASGGASAAKAPGRGAPSGRSEEPTRTPRLLSPPRGGFPTAGGRRGELERRSRRLQRDGWPTPHAPLPSQLCGRSLSPPTSTLPCGRRVYLHIRVQAGASATPLAGICRVTRTSTNPARGRRALPGAAYRSPRGRVPPARAA